MNVGQSRSLPVFDIDGVLTTTNVAVATGGWEPTARIKLRVGCIDASGIPLVSSSHAYTRAEILREAARVADFSSADACFEARAGAEVPRR